VDADLHSAWRDGLTEAVFPIHHGERWCIDHHHQLLISEDEAIVLHLDITLHADDTVAVMSGEIRSHEIKRDALCLGVRATGGIEDLGNELLQGVCANQECRRCGAWCGGHWMFCLMIAVCGEILADSARKVHARRE